MYLVIGSNIEVAVIILGPSLEAKNSKELLPGKGNLNVALIESTLAEVTHNFRLKNIQRTKGIKYRIKKNPSYSNRNFPIFLCLFSPSHTHNYFSSHKHHKSK